MNTMVALPILTSAPTTAPALPNHEGRKSAAITAADRCRRANQMFHQAYDEMDAAEEAANEKHGRRPCELIPWRHYSHIGGSELERVSRELIAFGYDPAAIELELLDAKKRYEAAVKAGARWDRRCGLTRFRRATDHARDTMQSARRAVETVEIHSVADASAILNVVYDGIEVAGGALDDWEVAAFKNAVDALRGIASV